VWAWTGGPETAAVTRWARGFVLLAALALPFSIALAQTAVTLGLLGWLADSVRRRSTGFARNPYLVPVALFCAVAVWSAFVGPRPELSVPKLRRLLWYLLIVAVPDLAGRDGQDQTIFVRRMIHALAAGACVAAVLHIVRLASVVGRPPEGMDPMFWIFHQGSMRTPQFHMTVLLLLLPCVRRPASALRNGPAIAALALNAVGLIAHFKRGVWGAFAGAIPFLVTGGARIWLRHAAAAAAALAMLLCIPAVRERIATAPRDFMVGGRWALWTRTAPRLRQEWPRGLGYEAMINRDVRYTAPGLEPKIDHLHNNALQIFVEMAWPGIVAWGAWMGMTLVFMSATRRRLAAAGHDAEPLARGLLAATVGLLLNGMVEVNFNAGVILMLFALLMGMSVALRDAAARNESPETDNPTGRT